MQDVRLRRAVCARHEAFPPQFSPAPEGFFVSWEWSAPAARDFVLELQVEDGFLKDNTGSYFLRVSGDRVEPAGSTAPQVTLRTDIAALSSLVMGAYSLDKAVARGVMDISDPSFLPDVQNAIGWHRKPVNYTYF